MEMTYSARLLDSIGEPIEGSVVLQVNLCTSEIDSSADWTDTFSVSATGGYVSLVLGSGSQTLSTELFATGEVWAETKIGVQVVGPRQRLTSVPSAAVAWGVRMESSPGQTACLGRDGELFYDTTLQTLRFCDGANWQSIVTGTQIGEVAGAAQWTDGTTATSCETYRRPDSPYKYAGTTGNGQYRIDPDGSGGVAPFVVQCDMTTQDGGWMNLSLSSAGSDDVYAMHGLNSPLSRSGDQARHYQHIASTDGFSSVEFTHNGSIGSDTTQNITFTNPATGSNFSDAQLDAIRALLSELGDDTRMVAGSVDGRNSTPESHEMKISDGNNANFIVTTYCTEDADETDTWHILQPGVNNVDDADMDCSQGGATTFTQLPVTHILPSQIQMGWFASTGGEGGGGAFWGYETSTIRVR